MSVGRICSRDIDTADARETARDAARRMHERQVGSLVVVDDESRPMGLVTDRDIAMRVVAAGCDPANTRVDAIMTPMPTTVLEDTEIETALGHMRVGRLRRLPVVDGTGTLVGMVTLDDVLAFVAEEFSLIGGLLRREAPHPMRTAHDGARL